MGKLTNTTAIVENFLNEHNLTNEDFNGTPERVARMYKQFFYEKGEFPITKKKPILTLYASDYKGEIALKNYIAWGFCPHHLIPVEYTFTIGYVPNGYIIGLSKLARIADYHITSLPLQEDLTITITNTLWDSLKPKKAFCRIKGYHLCAAMRGVKAREASFHTEEIKEE